MISITAPLVQIPATPLSVDTLVKQLQSRVHPLDLAPGTDVIGEVPEAPFVRPALVVTPKEQVVAFYDKLRRLTIARRGGWGEAWSSRKLDSELGWDSHNYPSIGISDDGVIHVAGNMHADELCYFRSQPGGDLNTLTKIPVMVDPKLEKQVTYPEFIPSPDGGLTFWFRNGGSGNGEQRCYRYLPENRKWKDIAPLGLIDGEGVRSAYLDANGTKVCDSRSNVTWVWRDTPDAESTHSISFMRYKSGKWVAANGTKIRLPARYGDATLVGEQEPGQGLINNNVRLIRSREDDVLILAQRRDENGHLQLVLWEWDGHRWSDQWLTRWNFRWNFGGRGTIRFEIEIGRPTEISDSIHVPVRVGGAFVAVIVNLVERTAHVQAANDDAWMLGGVLGSMGLGQYVEHDRHSTQDEIALLWWSSSPENRDLEGTFTAESGNPLRIISFTQRTE